MDEVELASISKCVSLKDMVPGSVVELLTLDERESEYGPFGMASFEATDAVGVLTTGRMILPERFIIDIESDGGLPAVYIYFGKVATSNGKVDAFYHDFRRVPADPSRPYSTLFPTSSHARELRATPVSELRSQLFTNTLSDVDTGATLVLYDLKYVKTSKSQKAPTVAFISTMSKEEMKEGGRERTGRLYLPARCSVEFRSSDMRVARYLGLKKGKGGRSYHDLVFVPSAWLEKEAVGGVADPRLLEAKPKAAKRTSRAASGGSPAKTATKSRNRSRVATVETQSLSAEESCDDDSPAVHKQTTKSKAKKTTPLKDDDTTDCDSEVEFVSSQNNPKRKPKPTATPLAELDKIRKHGPPTIFHMPHHSTPLRPKDDFLLEQYLRSVRNEEAETIDAGEVDTAEIDLSGVETQDPFNLNFDAFETEVFAKEEKEVSARSASKPASARKIAYENISE